MTRPGCQLPRARAATLTAVACLSIAACSHRPAMHWPWHHPTATAPAEVHELVITREDGTAAAYPQYWQGNTLVVGLESAGGSGHIVLQPREHTLWPVRIAFRVMPGQIGALEVQANQRLVLPITASGSRPVDLELDPGVFIMKTPRIDVQWGPSIQPSGS